MGFFVLLGLAGLYARQAEKAGWLGLVGFILYSLGWVLTLGYSFAEAFILPLLATQVACICERLPGGLLQLRRPELRTPRQSMDHNRGTVYTRWTAVWHRYVPCRHPSALGGRFACARVHFVSPGFAASTRVRAAGGRAGGISFGLAGIFALLRTASASLGTLPMPGTLTLPRKLAAQPSLIRLSSLQAACSGSSGKPPLDPLELYQNCSKKPVAPSRTTHNEIGDYFLCRVATQKIITKYQIRNQTNEYQ